MNTCATCRWKGNETAYGGKIVTCQNPDNKDDPSGAGTCVVCFVRDDFSCPRWERREDLADRIAEACLVEFKRHADPEDDPVREQRILSAVAAVVRPMLEEEKP